VLADLRRQRIAIVARGEKVTIIDSDQRAFLKLPAKFAGSSVRGSGTDEAVEWGADLIIVGLRYKKRFGGAWDAGRTVPYVMRNSTAPVWCLRVETEDLARTP